MKTRLISTIQIKPKNIRSRGVIGGWRKRISLFDIGLLRFVPDDDLDLDVKLAIVHVAQEWNDSRRRP